MCDTAKARAQVCKGEAGGWLITVVTYNEEGDLDLILAEASATRKGAVELADTLAERLGVVDQPTSEWFPGVDIHSASYRSATAKYWLHCSEEHKVEVAS